MDEEEIILDNGCFHCHVRPSHLGLIADGIECDYCLNNDKLLSLKNSLRMPNIKIIHVDKNSIIDSVINKEEACRYDNELKDFLDGESIQTK